MSDFETQLKDRLERSAASVSPTDEVFDRAADRYRAHTRRRIAVGGALSAAVVALAVLAVPALLDGPETPDTPIIDQGDGDPSPDGAAQVPDLVIADAALLDEIGVPDGVLRDHTLVRAYGLDDDAWLLQTVDPGGTDRIHLWRAGDEATSEVASTDPADGEGVTIDLHGWIRGPSGELVALLTRTASTEQFIQQVMLLTDDAREDTLIPVRAGIARLSAHPEPAPPGYGANYVLVADYGDGSDQLDAFDPGGSPVDPLTLRHVCDACVTSSVTVGGQRAAYLSQHTAGRVTLNVEDLDTGELEASAPVDSPSVLSGSRIEVEGDHVLINVSPTERWHLHVPTQRLTELDDDRPGYATMRRTEATRTPVGTDDPEPTGSASSEDPYWLAGVPGVGRWSDIPAPPAPDGGRWRLGDPVWTGELVIGLAGLEGPEEQDSGPPELSEALMAYDPAAGSWTQLAEPPGRGSLHWADDRLILLGRSVGETIADTWRTWSYDVGTDRWTEHEPVPLSPRTTHSETWTGTELIVWGGLQIYADDDALRTMTYADGAAFDPGSGTWRQLAASPLASRGDHGAVWNGRRLVVFGGGHTDSFEGEFYWSDERDDAAVYDPATDSWTTIQSPGRIGPLVAADWTGTHILAWTGNPYPEDRPFGWIWDPVSGDAVEIPEDLPARELFNYRDHIDHQWAPEIGRWVLWGGGCGEGCNAAFAHGYLFDPDTMSWELINDPDERTGFASGSVWIGDRLVVVGGGDGRGQPTTHRRDAAPRVWRP